MSMVTLKATLLDFISMQQRTRLQPSSFTTVAGAACKCKLNAYKLLSLMDSANTSVFVATGKKVFVRRSDTQAEYRKRHRLIA